MGPTPGERGSGSNGNEGSLHSPQKYRTAASTSDGLVSYPENLLAGVLLLFKSAASV